MKCDIIIPVYNAYDCLAECIDSVLRHTNFTSARLILIDDKSPDPRVLPLLEKYASKHPDKITLLKNPENLGFVGTANYGMRYSKNDVLLLNSDTVVTKNWLTKLQTCAYSSKNVATVTPLGNNMTPLRFPDAIRIPGTPNGYTLDQFANLVEKVSMHLYPELPSAHGFCMYIKRTALEQVGLFDEKTFGKGYGEENDFSFRCIEAGLQNLLCDDTYILHKGSQSFQDSAKYHDGELWKKHPVIRKKVDDWYQKHDLDKITDNVTLAIAIKEARPNLLIFADNATLSGLVYSIDKLRAHYNLHLLILRDESYCLHSIFKELELDTAIFEKSFLVGDTNLHSREYEAMLKTIFKDFDISLALDSSAIDKIASSESLLKTLVQPAKLDFLTLQQHLLYYRSVINIIAARELYRLGAVGTTNGQADLDEFLRLPFIKREKLNPHSKIGKLLRAPTTIRHILENKQKST